MSTARYWILVDPISGDEPKIVHAPTRDDALNVAADAWGYLEADESNREVRDEFKAEAFLTPLTDDQAKALRLEEEGYVTEWVPK